MGKRKNGRADLILRLEAGVFILILALAIGSGFANMI